MSLVLAVIPILIVLIGIIFLKKPAWIVALIGAGITFILAVTAFSGEIPAMAATAKAGSYQPCRLHSWYGEHSRCWN